MDYERKPQTFRTQQGDVVVKCDWCGDTAYFAQTLESGRSAYSCSDCEGKMRRFYAAVSPSMHGRGLGGTGWLPSPDQPDLVIHREGQTDLTIRDHRDFKAKALKELLPPVKARRKASRKSQEELSPTERLDAIAKRRKELDRERERLEREIVAMAKSKTLPVARIASALGVSRQRVYQLAA